MFICDVCGIHICFMNVDPGNGIHSRYSSRMDIRREINRISIKKKNEHCFVEWNSKSKQNGY